MQEKNKLFYAFSFVFMGDNPLANACRLSSHIDAQTFTYNLHLLSDISMFYIKHLTICKVHMHAGAIRKLLYGCAYVRVIIHLLKLVDYLTVHTHKP